MAIRLSKCKYLRSALFVGISMLIILIGGSVTMLWQLNQTQSSRAAGSSVIGSPSLPAATVDGILRRMGSPMVGAGKIIERASRATNVDDAFALGVWWTETNDGEAGVGLADRNPGSVRGSPGYPAAFDGYTIYPSYGAAVTDWFNILRGRYVNRGLVSVYAICYPYVGTSSAPLWAAKVVNLMLRYRGEAPPPAPPTIVATPTRPPLAARNHRSPWPADLSSTQVVTSVPVTQPKHVTVSVPVALVKVQQVETLPVSKTLPVGMGLLSALAIGLWGFKIRRNGLPVPIPVRAVWQPSAVVTAYPPLYVNEFSPVLEQQPLSVLYEVAERQTDRFALPGVEQLSFPGISPWIPMVAPEAPEPATSGAGLLSRYYNAEASPQRMILQPFDSGSELLMSENDVENNPTIEMLSLRGMSLPGSYPESVSVRSGGGLLRRYRNGQQ